jgi:hypothetical protein
MITRQVAQRDSNVAGFAKSLKAFLHRELARLTKDLEGKEISAIDAARILGGLRQNLAQAGLGDVLVEIDSLYASELARLDETLSRVSRGVAVFTSADVSLVQTLATYDIEQIANEIDLSVDELRSYAVRQAMTGRKVELSEVIGTLSDRLERHSETIENTSLSGFYRALTVSKSEELGLDLFVYLGPEDEVTREFCAERVGKVYSREEIDRWDNGQGLDVWTYLGGYNCRHQLSPISLEDAERLYGYKAS